MNCVVGWHFLECSPCVDLSVFVILCENHFKRTIKYSMCVSMWQCSVSAEVEFGASDLNRASSPSGDLVVCELCPCLRRAPLRRLSTSCSVVIHLSPPSSQAWRCWNQATPPSWCTIWTVCTGNPGRSCSTRAPPAWASTSWVVKMARGSLSPSSWPAARPT